VIKQLLVVTTATFVSLSLGAAEQKAASAADQNVSSADRNVSSAERKSATKPAAAATKSTEAPPKLKRDVPPAAAPAETQPAQHDSPLVAAAKRTNRLNKKPAFVITNDNLQQFQDAHWTTTATQEPIRPAAEEPQGATSVVEPPANERPQKSAAQLAEEKKKKDEQDRQRKLRASAAEEDGFMDVDPDVADQDEKAGSQPAETKPQ
jgi:hypothetical protein